MRNEGKDDAFLKNEINTRHDQDERTKETKNK